MPPTVISVDNIPIEKAASFLLYVNSKSEDKLRHSLTASAYLLPTWSSIRNAKWCISFKWHLPCYHLIENNSQRIYVRTLIDIFAIHLFR